MDNEEKQNRIKEKEFERRFLAEVRASEDASVKSNNDRKKKKRALLIGLSAFVVLIIVIIVVSVVLIRSSTTLTASDEDEDEDDGFFDADTSMIEVLVAPGSARVMIDGKQYTNGKYEVSPGEYKVVVEADGFETHEETVVVVDKHRSYVATCLQPVQENGDYYEINAEDAQICQAAEEMAGPTAWDQNALLDEIFEFTPYHNDNDGFYVDPYFNEKDELIVELTFKDCSQTATVLKNRAIAWMKEQGLNPDTYTFEESWDCEEE